MNVFIMFVMIFDVVPFQCLADDVVVIVNPSVSETTLSNKDISNIYLGKKSSWGNGGKIKFVILTGDIQVNFLKNYVGKTETQYNTFWKKQVFTGKGSPPQEFDSDKAMVEFAAQTIGAIGYVSAGTDVSKVKTITIQ
jgi:ABC-type phosphate transport system substrate-binding protein